MWLGDHAGFPPGQSNQQVSLQRGCSAFVWPRCEPCNGRPKQCRHSSNPVKIENCQVSPLGHLQSLKSHTDNLHLTYLATGTEAHMELTHDDLLAPTHTRTPPSARSCGRAGTGRKKWIGYMCLRNSPTRSAYLQPKLYFGSFLSSKVSWEPNCRSGQFKNRFSYGRFFRTGTWKATGGDHYLHILLLPVT